VGRTSNLRGVAIATSRSISADMANHTSYGRFVVSRRRRPHISYCNPPPGHHQGPRLIAIFEGILWAGNRMGGATLNLRDSSLFGPLTGRCSTLTPKSRQTAVKSLLQNSAPSSPPDGGEGRPPAMAKRFQTRAARRSCRNAVQQAQSYRSPLRRIERQLESGDHPGKHVDAERQPWPCDKLTGLLVHNHDIHLRVIDLNDIERFLDLQPPPASASSPPERLRPTASEPLSRAMSSTRLRMVRASGGCSP
jgi:hypothetical protein